MNDDVQKEKLLIVLHKACSEIRALVKLREQQRVYDLADTIEFIPELMLHWRLENWECIRNALNEYQRNYPGSGFDFGGLLDMDAEEFRKCYVDVQPAAQMASHPWSG